MSQIPNELLYTREHEWIRIEGTRAYIGITDFAQHELGDIVFVELPETEQMMRAHESFGTVESVKTVSDLYAPLSGKILEVNSDLIDHPERVNEQPYGEGWMLVIDIENQEEIQSLLTAEAYQAHIKE